MLRSGRRHFLVFAGIVIVVLGLLGIPANAVHDQSVIELEGDVADASPTSDPRDWASIFDSNGQPISSQLPANTIDTTGVIRDFTPGETKDSTYHEQSNKDTQQINEAAGSNVWGCKSLNNASDKNDIVNAYALTAKGTGPHDGDALTYFGVERYDNSGTAFMGVWLFQADVGCDAAAGKFTGKKTTGDILILSNFTNGGSLSSLVAYKWTENSTNPTTGEGTLAEIVTGFECSASPAADDLCAEVNTADVVVPWPMEDKEKSGSPDPDPPRTLETSEFFEGGFSLTDLVPGAPCFSSFMAEARASDTTTASLKDFVLGDLDTCASIVAHKFHDLDGNGEQDNNDPNLSGWAMSLFNNNNCSGSAIDNGTTDANGEVRFTGLPAGTYSLQETQQSGWNVTTGATCTQVSVTAGGSPRVSFGNQRPASITAHKFEDIDGNGAQDAGESDLGGWEMKLYTNPTCAGTATSTGTTDGSSGETVFTGVNAGAYSVQETPQTGWQVTTSGETCQNVTLESGSSGFLSFGNQRTPGAVRATKFNDLNGNGTQEQGEPGLQDWPMTLYSDPGCSGPVQETSATAANGNATFAEVLVGDYSVGEGSDPAWTPSTPTCRDITVTSGSTAAVVFGNWRPASITALKFEDKNGNAVKDADDPELQGWQMTLYAQEGCAGNAVASGITAGDGTKLFANLSGDRYSVKETMQEEWEASTPTCQGVTLTAGASETLKFGNKKIVVVAAEVVSRPKPVAVAPAALAATGAATGSRLVFAFVLMALGLVCLLIQRAQKERRPI